MLTKKEWYTDAIHLDPLPQGKKIFFASDFHLNSQPTEKEIQKEIKILTWLSKIQQEAHALFLLGDIFNFWIEYKYVIPKGFIQFQHKILEFKALNIPVFFFVGNRDLWTKGYLEQALGVKVFHQPVSFTVNNKCFLVGHGDTINMTKTYSLLRRIYSHPLFKWLLQITHPDIIISLAQKILYRNQKKHKKKSVIKERDRIFIYCKENIAPYWHHDFYIFGHTHCPFYSLINTRSHYCNLGDWVKYYTYGVFDGISLQLTGYN